MSTDENPAIEDIPASRATEQLDAPLTWADIEVAEQPVIHRAPAVDSRYLEEKFLLGTPGDRA